MKGLEEDHAQECEILTAQGGTKASREEHCAIPCAIAAVATVKEPRIIQDNFIVVDPVDRELSMETGL